MTRVTSMLDRAKGLFAGFTTGQRAVVAVAAVALIFGAFALTRMVSQPSWTPLYGGLSGTDASAIVEQLKSDGVPYQLANGGTTVMVPQAQVYDLRVALSGQGLPSGEGEGGYSLLDEQGITATDFQQNVAYRRALEGELAKTLQALDGVNTAVVHLAIPKKDVFATEEDKTTASVLMALAPGAELDRKQVRSVTQLVANSVEGLDPANVTVTDSTGKTLSSSAGTGGAVAEAANEADEQTAAFEQRVGGAVQDMLDTVLGTGHSVVRVNATLDFDSQDTTSERYVYEDGVPPVSESELNEEYETNGGGAGGALGQTLPEIGAGAGGSSGNYTKEQRTVNNSVGKVVERVQAAPGSVERLTVAVALDANAETTASAAQIEDLVANAIGLDTERGDTVQVDSLPFDNSAAEAAEKELAEAEAAAKMAGYIDLGKKAGLGLLGLVALFLLFRRRKSTTVTATASDLDAEAAAPVLMPANAQPAIGAGPREPSERDRQREQISALVDNQPDEVAQLIQSWLAERSA